MWSRILRKLASVGVMVGLIGSAGQAAAAPPVSVKGLGVPTALSFYDRARRAAAAVRRLAPDSSDSDSREGRLEAVDTVVLDPGHGDDKSGAVGVAGIQEKFLTLELAYALRERLQRAYPDLRVVLTRYWDRSRSLHERTHLANRIGADLFLSLHYNAAVHRRAVGFETYFLATREAVPGRERREGEPVASASSEVTGLRSSGGEEEFGVQGDSLAVIRRDLRRARQHRWSGRLAETVQGKLEAHIDSVDRGVKQANFAVLRGAMMPAVVVEGGFLSHPEEGRRVLRTEHRNELVEALTEAVRRYDRSRSEAARSPDETGEGSD